MDYKKLTKITDQAEGKVFILVDRQGNLVDPGNAFTSFEAAQQGAQDVVEWYGEDYISREEIEIRSLKLVN